MDPVSCFSQPLLLFLADRVQELVQFHQSTLASLFLCLIVNLARPLPFASTMPLEVL